jgi:hypothetical protein
MSAARDSLHPVTVTSALAHALVLAAALAGCGDDSGGHDDDHDHPDAAVETPDAEPPPDGAGTAALTVGYAHLVDGAPVTIGTETPYTNAAGNAYGVTVVRYFLSDLVLTYADDTEHEVAGAYYVDHDLPETMTRALADVPTGELASVRFVFGVPPALNVTGAFTAPPESLMEWPEMMGGGYHHMKFEGRYVNEADEPFQFRAHSGPLSGTDYTFEVVLDATGHEVTADGADLTIEMNLEEWFENPNLWDLNDFFYTGHMGIMNDAAAQLSLSQNGAGVFTLGAP